MFLQLIESLKDDDRYSSLFETGFHERKIPARTVLLREGEISDHAHVIRKGCLREWFNKDGKDITFQFFMEGQAVASIDSFLNRLPSLYTIESIEPSEIISVSRENFDKLQELFPEFKEQFQALLFKRFRNYANLFLSRIRDSPRERYEDLLRNHPELIARIPQHYLASYLGITPISLSRIRNRK